MRSVRLLVVLGSLLLVAAGCGDDDSGGLRPGVDAGAGADVTLPEGVELPEGLEGLPDNASELIEDLQDGSLDDTDLEDLMDAAENMAEGFADDGRGTVTVAGDTFDVTSEVCLAFDGDVSFEGQGTAPDGTPVWVSISRSEDTRAEMLEFMDETFVDQIYGDADPIVDASFAAVYGQEGMFGSGSDDLPDYDASTTSGTAEIDVEVDGDTARGSGAANDFNGSDFTETFPFSFEVTCG